MADIDIAGLEKNLAFVASAVRRRQGTVASLAANVMWGVVILIGFSMNDWYPPGVLTYWAFSLPLAVAVSVAINWRAGRRIGEDDSVIRRRLALHWGGMAAAVGLLFVLTAANVVGPEALRLPVLVLLALGYFLAGVHLDRSYMWAGVVMAAGAVAAIFVQQYLPTMIGAAVCAALVICAAVRMRKA